MKPKKTAVQNQVMVVKCLADASRLPDRNNFLMKKNKNPTTIGIKNNGDLGIYDYAKGKGVNFTKSQKYYNSSSDSSRAITSTHISSKVNTAYSLPDSEIMYHDYMKRNRRIKQADQEILKRCKLSNLTTGDCENNGAFNNIYVTKKNSIHAQVTKKRKLLAGFPPTYPLSSRTSKRPLMKKNCYNAIHTYSSSVLPLCKQPTKFVYNERPNFRYNDKPTIPMWACHSNTKIIASKHILRLPQKQKKRKSAVKKQGKCKGITPSASSIASTIKFKYLSKDITEADIFIKEFKKKLHEAKIKNRPPKVVRENKLRPLIYHTAGSPIYVWNYEDIMRKMK